MKDGNRNIIAAVILALGMIISAIIYAYSNRYKLIDGGFGVVDTWTKKIEQVRE